ncbi:hypothetical protein ASD64_11010 [Mesorhizobium sp. Root157]|nr:hypothetical protein ASD64_11010 [Mesorhizobium sp. Root157]
MQCIRRGEIPAVFALRGLYSVILEAGHILIWLALKLLEAAGFVYHISPELDPALRRVRHRKLIRCRKAGR